MGGVVICVPGGPVRLDPPPELEALLVVPEEPVRTREARQALPREVPMVDAVHNLAHASLLTLGLERGDWDMVSRSLSDRLHQPYRAHLYPRSAALLERARELGALGATVSGAGPTVMVWSHFQQTGGLMETLRRETDGWAHVMRVPFEPHGAAVREL